MADERFINTTAFLEYFIIAGVGIVVAIMLFVIFGFGTKEKLLETEAAIKTTICLKAFIPDNCSMLDIDGDGKEDCMWNSKQRMCVPK